MSVTIGSLYGEDQRLLEDLDLLPRLEDSDLESSESESDRELTTSGPPTSTTPSTLVVPSNEPSPALSRTYRHGTMDGIPWFEEMIEGSGLGKLMKNRRGAGVSDDQSTSIEWEVSEWTDEGREGENPPVQAMGKRKRGANTGFDDT